MERSMTGLEEATLRIAQALKLATAQYKSTPWYAFRERIYSHGVVYTLGMVYDMLHSLVHKYDNSTGEHN